MISETLVPCNGCTACCKHELLFLHPECGDNPADYLTQDIGPRSALQQKSNGDCIYLGEQGCAIWQKRPSMCREFDCRRQHLGMHRRQRKALVASGLASQEVLDAGRKRGHTLTRRERREARQHRKSDQEFAELLENIGRWAQ